jgi:hypothetical protein
MRLEIHEDPRLEASVDVLSDDRARFTVTYPREPEYHRAVRAALRALLRPDPTRSPRPARACHPTPAEGRQSA